jgi:hypothetical protein
MTWMSKRPPFAAGWANRCQRSKGMVGERGQAVGGAAGDRPSNAHRDLIAIWDRKPNSSLFPILRKYGFARSRSIYGMLWGDPL